MSATTAQAPRLRNKRILGLCAFVGPAFVVLGVVAGLTQGNVVGLVALVLVGMWVFVAGFRTFVELGNDALVEHRWVYLKPKQSVPRADITELTISTSWWLATQYQPTLNAATGHLPLVSLRFYSQERAKEACETISAWAGSSPQ